MTEQQAEQIISLLSKICKQLDDIKSGTRWTQSNTSSIESTLSVSK